jgi:acyl carrier protein
MSESEIRDQLRAWVLDRARDKPSNLTDETPLLETGLLSSMDVVDLILFVEQLRGDEVDVDELQPEAVGSVNAIYSAFFAAAG